MSEPRLITPLLENHIMGEPISEHHGVRCCPAMNSDSQEKYIVKIISIPASSRQLDALLLSGAYPSRDSALRYFMELANETVDEAKLLQKLSKLEGFCGYDGWQIEPMEDGSGYDVYLLSPYGNTLERHLRHNPMTHLGAVNLGLDLCAALSVARRNGYLYVDLKPENIFISDTKGYLIGDLGFVNLRSLKYASLPDKYRSAYTAPEIQDAYSSLNDTIDIYAAGLVLYQVYNGGSLPDLDEPILPPVYADYEMSEIILKACAEDPADRWQDPQEMGQALVGYMQRNTVNDDPIIPIVVPEAEQPEEEPEIIPATEDISEETVSEEVETAPESEEEIPSEVEEPSDEDPLIPVPAEQFEEEPGEEESAEDSEEESPIPDESEETGDEAAEEQPEEDEELEQFVIEGFLFDETLPDEDAVAELTDTVISDEVIEMLAQADELIAHKAPDPVVAPEPVEIPMPDPILPEPEPESEAAPETEEEPLPDEAATEPEEASNEAEDNPFEDYDEEVTLPPRPKKKLGCLIGTLILILLLLLTGLGGKYYYDHYYLQNIAGITLDGAENWLIVNLDTQIDNTLLTVTCTDIYGNKLTRKVVNNQAVFESLPSGTSYKINVLIDGRHQLTGSTTASYTTATQTSIVGFSAIAGDTDGSVILSFSVQGPDSDSGWLVKYSADGVAEQTAPCSGHMAIISGLEVGKDYTFHLVSVDELYVVSGDTLNFTATKVIYAEDLTIHGFENGSLIASWSVPEGATVENWTVRCYNSTGYDTTFTVTEPSIAISDLDISQSYTLDVTASGMTVSKWTSISANSITFKDILIDHSDPSRLVITWPYEGTVPEGGWQLRYSVDGSDPVIVPCEKNTCTLDTLVPGGHYKFSFVLPEDISVFGGTAECTAADVQMFEGYDITASDMSIGMCRVPDLTEWTHADIAEDAYTTDFLVGDRAGFVIYLNAEYVTSQDEIEVMYVIRNQDGTLISIETYTETWINLWYQGYCELELPALPDVPGNYTVDIYFNDTYISKDSIAFTVS